MNATSIILFILAFYYLVKIRETTLIYKKYQYYNIFHTNGSTPVDTGNFQTKFLCHFYATAWNYLPFFISPL